LEEERRKKGGRKEEERRKKGGRKEEERRKKGGRRGERRNEEGEIAAERLEIMWSSTAARSCLIAPEFAPEVYVRH
jgi:hypothetical protein